jgi:four helix bundle protein
MGISDVENLVAYQVAQEYKRAVYALLDTHPLVAHDIRFLAQIRDAASSVEANIAEGFHRKGAGDFRRFLTFARGSLGEAQARLLDGVDRRYYTRAECEEAYQLGRRVRSLVEALSRSLAPYTKARQRSVGHDGPRRDAPR